MQTLDINLAANDIKIFDIGGSYFELIEGNGAVDVNFVDSNGSRAKDLEMLAALPGYWVSGTFSRFELKNVAGYAQTVRVMFGSGSGGSRRIQGTVKVVDQSTDKTSAGGQFLQSNTIVAGAGQGAVIALHPNGSLKRVAVKSLFVQSAIAGGILLAYGTGGGSLGLSAAGVALKSKLLNGTPSDARTGASYCAGVSPTAGEVTGITNMARFYIPANDTRQLKFDTPLVLTGTSILIVSAEVLNRDLSVVFDVEETL